MNNNLVLSMKEANRISILEKVKQKSLKQGKAADILGISVRQLRRLVRSYKKDGASGLTHKLRGLPSNNRCNEGALINAVKIVQSKYSDFSVTLIHEKLSELHGFPYGRETLRKELIQTGLWHPKRQSKPVIHKLRDRRNSEGELVQADGSPHAWFENRGPYCNLLVFIDDATGKLKWLEFTVSETTKAYFSAVRSYLLAHGKPIAFYVDQHSVFRVNTSKNQSAATSDSNGLTQFGRAMKELDIGMIFANSPQAKGRVEKVNQTLQDRLVKELRLKNISTITEANRYLPEFMAYFNRKFAVVSRSPVNIHRPLIKTDNLDEILVEKHRRILSKQLTASYQNRIYQITEDRPSYAMRHAPVVIVDNGKGSIIILYKGKPLSYRTVTIQPKAEIVDSKHINQAVERLVNRIGIKPELTHPWRQPYLYW